MFKKNNFEQKHYNQPRFNGQMNDFMQTTPGMQMPGMLPNMQFERLQYEIMENRRRINNLAKRMARVESYLRIRDTPEYGYTDDESKPNNFSY